MKENRIHKTAERPPQFPCYVWHAEEKTYIYAWAATAFHEGWESAYTYWHEDQPAWPTEEPTTE